MKISISTFAIIKSIIDARRLPLVVPDKSTVEEALDVLINRFGEPLSAELRDEEGKYRTTYLYALNGRFIHCKQGMETLLAEGDELLIFPPVGGG